MNSDQQIKVLIVEDDRVNAMLLKGMLGHSSLIIEKADHAETISQAVEYINEHTYDVILLDLNLPDSKGSETLDRIEDCFMQATVIVITGEYDEGLGMKAIAKGAQDYLLKGKYDVSDLTKSIRYSVGRKKADEEARKNKQLFETLITQLPHRILLKDRNSVFLYCNEKYATYAGTTPGNLIGKTDYDFFSSEAADTHIQDDKEVIRSGQTKESLFRYERNGEEVVTRLIKTAVTNHKGDVDGILCVFEDFTQRVKAEERLKQANEELEQTNQQLRNTQSQLVQNEKLASIGQLAAGIAHEINNPMAFVVSNFQSLDKYISRFIELLGTYEELTDKISTANPEILKQDAEKIGELREDMSFDFILEDVQDLMDDSREGMDRIIHIVRNLRDFSRVDQPEDYSDFDLNEGIRATLVVARNELKYSTEVVTEFTDVPQIFCNSGQLNQVFLNILVNAAQAIQSQNRDEMGTIHIKTYAETEYVVCEIADDGPGIPQEHLNKIFDPFFTTKPAGKGTGLGLNVSYDIVVNKHKGKLLVDSNMGKGTTFTIKLPIQIETSKEEEEAKNGKEDSLVCG